MTIGSAQYYRGFSRAYPEGIKNRIAQGCRVERLPLGLRCIKDIFNPIGQRREGFWGICKPPIFPGFRRPWTRQAWPASFCTLSTSPKIPIFIENKSFRALPIGVVRRSHFVRSPRNDTGQAIGTHLGTPFRQCHPAVGDALSE